MPRSVRDVAIIIILIGGSFLLIFSSAKKADTGLARGLLYSLMRPFEQAVFGVHREVANFWRSYIDLIGVQKENQGLKEEIRRLKRDRATLSARESENLRLKKLLNIKSRYDFPSLVAQVIGEDASGWYRTFFINRGSEDGVSANMPVTAAEGVVGRVVRSSADMAQVLLISDPNLSLDCRVVRTRDRGILKGSLDRGCVLRYISIKSQVEPGDELETSGLDGVFPRGLTVGRIDSVRSGDQGMFLEAHVIPAANLSAIEEVLVILASRGGFDIRPGLEDKR
ncbi:MAG: rod shape-determining protein MreC [Desulfomonile sp.]|jgi:rod shape-determining protein MreC